MEPYEIAVTIRFALDQEAIRRILASLRDGFGRYWFRNFDITGAALAGDVCEHFSLGGTIRFFGRDGMGDYDLTREMFLRGIHLYLEKQLPKEIIFGKGIDTGLTDEFVVSDIVEYSLFGHLLRESEEHRE